MNFCPHVHLLYSTFEVCPRSVLESWLRWLKNLMYKHEGLSLYPQEIQEWLFIPLISSGGAEGLIRTDLAGFLGSQMRKTKQKQNKQANKECSKISERSCSKEIRQRIIEQDTRNAPLAYRCTHAHTGGCIPEPMHCLLLTRNS